MASIKLTGDTSGEITISAPAVAGTNTITLPASSGTMITSSNISTYATNPPSGAEVISLNSGNTSATLTSSSSQLLMINADAAGYSIVMPDATTLTAGSSSFRMLNVSGFPIAIKDNGGTIRDHIAPLQDIAIKIKDTSSTNGLWVINNPAISAYEIINATGENIATLSNVTGNRLGDIIRITDTQYILTSYANQVSPILYATPFQINLTTKAITWGTEVTLFSGNSNQNLGTIAMGSSNGVDRGIFTWGPRSLNNAMAYQYAQGFYVNNNTLYISSSTDVYQLSSANQRDIEGTSWYCNADDAFMVMGREEQGGYAKARGMKVSVAGTTVTLTLSSATYTSSASAACYFAPTSYTTFVVDDANNTVYDYINYNTSTNTLTYGARTTQTSIIAGTETSGLIPYCASFSENYERANGRKQLIVYNSGASIYYYNKAVDVANVGTATVTVTAADVNTKTALASTYEAVTSSTSTGLGYSVGINDYAEISANNYQSISVWATVKGFVDPDTLQINSFDPTNSELNINYGAKGTVDWSVNTYTTQGYNSFILSTGQVLTFDFIRGNTPSDTYKFQLFTPATVFTA